MAPDGVSPDPGAGETDGTAEPAARRPAARPRASDVQRLTARLAAADEALEQERGRRETVDRALDRERSEGRRLRAELGRLTAELDLARAGLQSARGALDRADEDLAPVPGPVRGSMPAREPVPVPARADADRVPVPPPRRPERVERSSRRSPGRRTNWLGRALALLMMIAVIAAVAIVIHSTISP